MTFVAIEGARLRMPSTWSLVPFKRIAALREDPDAAASAMLLSLKNTGELVARGDDVQPPSDEHRLRYWRVDPGDLVVNPMWLAGGAIGVSLVSGAVSPDYRVYALSLRVEPRFIHHLFRSVAYHDQYRLLMRAETTFDRRVTKEDFAELPVSVPPLDAQRAIVDFLDAETARIDALIEKKQRLSQVLGERLQSLIWAKLTESMPGRNWVPLKSVAAYREGPGILAVDFREEGVPLLRIGNLVGDSVVLDGCGYLDPADVGTRWAQFRVRAGELLISGSATSGLPVVVPTEAAGAVPYTGLIRVWPRSASLDRDFLRFFLASGLFETQVDQLKTGVAIQHWGPSHLAQVRMPLPSTGMQRRLANALKEAHGRTLAAVARIERHVELLREHRQALITAAVTGELDVAARAG